MTDYTELVKALRCCAENFGCPIECPRYSPADEGVRACVSRLEKDAAAAIEALQAEIRESMQKCAECGDRMVEPKRGEWKVDMSHFSPHIVCSVCGVEIPCVAGWCMDAHMNYCPNCGAKMEVQE